MGELRAGPARGPSDIEVPDRRGTAPEGPATTSELLRPYVPRLVIDWLRATPDEIHREIEATLVFVDISGFTALTERLSKKGKIGAELMRDTLDGVFRALLDEAYDWGAGLLKWGGDALLLLFDGPEHELRASRAAWEMQRTIDRVGRLHLTGGTLVLRMSVGIGTGSFHFFMTGSVHRELLVAGPAMTETLQMEAIADAGEIGITPTLAARLHPACVGPWKDAAILLVAPPDVDRRRAPDVGDVSQLDIASCIPVATRAQVLLQKSEPEHRTITAAFIDLMDTDELLRDLGPEVLASGLDERIRQIEEAALQFEVPFYETDVGKSSVKALLTAGAPSSTGHDEERMLRTLRAIIEQPGLVPMRIGVNTGKVFTGDFGPPYRRAYRVFGDAINTAARVMSKAEAGQILSTEIVLDRSRTLFDTTSIPPFAAKGKAQPVRASIVGPAIGTREGRKVDLALIGRDRELAVLLGAATAAGRGRGGAVEIQGAPGTGKSRLVDEVVARSGGARALRSRCEEYEASTPYFPLRAIIRSLLDADASASTDAVARRLGEALETSSPDLVSWAPLLGILLGIDLPPTPATRALNDRFLRERLAEVTWQFLQATIPGPVILAIEDAEHMDEASRDLLSRLFGASGEHGALLILTRQTDDPILDLPYGDDGRAIVLVLEPLEHERVIDIVNAATEESPLRPHEVEEIARRSGGNPLFLFELLDAVRASGSIGSLPDSIESLIAGEIDRLAPTDRTILRYAAVLGTSLDPRLLAVAVRDDVELDASVWGRLAALVHEQPDGTLRFPNTLVRDVAYEGLPYRRRRVLHERVGNAIEAMAGSTTDEEVGTLALHFHEAQRWDKAWRYARQAGDRAMKVYAIADASRFYERALAAGRRLRAVQGRDLAEAYDRWSDSLHFLGRYHDADRALKAARRLVKADPIEVAPLAIKQAISTSRTGQYRRTNLRVSRALRALDGVTGRDAAAHRARLMVITAGTRFLQNRRVESIEWARRAEREAKRAGAKDALAQTYKLLDMAFKENGQIEKAVYSRRALALYEEIGDLPNQAVVLNNLGILAQERSAWDEALDLYRRCLAITELTGDRSDASLAKYNIAEILSDQGRLDEAESLLREVLRVWRASGADADVADARRELGKLLARRGDFEGAHEMLSAALAEQVRSGKAGEALATMMRQAERHLLAGDGAAGLAATEEASAMALRVEGGSVFSPILSRLHAIAMAQAGDPEAAGTELVAALDSARKRGDAYETALVADALLGLARIKGVTVPSLAAERSTCTKRLGIVLLPNFPLVPAGLAVPAGAESGQPA